METTHLRQVKKVSKISDVDIEVLCKNRVEPELCEIGRLKQKVALVDNVSLGFSL